MTRSIIRSKRAIVYVFALVAAVGSFAVTQGPELADRSVTFTPDTMFGIIAPLIVVVVALGQLFGSRTPVSEGITLTHLAIASVWVVYLLAGIGLVSVGYTGWMVLLNLLVAVSAGLIFGYLYSRR